MPSPAADALWLLEAATGLSRTALLLEGDRALGAAEAELLWAMTARREAREPLQHVVGRAPFYGLELTVDGRVLVPRPETEGLVELVLARLRRAGAANPLVLDVGSGSGAVALAIKSELPGAEVWGTDVSAAALDVARGNAARLGLEVTFLRSDLLAAPEVRAVAARCAALVANLPYLPNADAGGLAPEAAADPALALYGGPSGLEPARRLVDQAEALLPAGALLALELDPRNVAELAADMPAWKDVGVLPDLAGRQRYLLALR